MLTNNICVILLTVITTIFLVVIDKLKPNIFDVHLVQISPKKISELSKSIINDNYEYDKLKPYIKNVHLVRNY
jgi:hypothetical protein